jgi:Protein of unknown function (DUF3224)
MSTRSARRAGAGIAIVLAALPIHVAAAAGSQGTQHLQAHALNISIPEVAACDPAGRCIGTYTGTSTLTGDLTGSFLNYGAVYGDLTAYWNVNLSLFQGDVEGCGTGTVVFSFPLDGPNPVDGHFTVIEGSGTGDLAGMTGTGRYHLTATASGIDGQLSLRVRC